MSIGFQAFADDKIVQVRLKTDTGVRRRSVAASSTGNAAALDRSGQAGGFLAILEEVLPASTPEKASLQALWSQMPAAERDLLSRQSAENLERYKDLVKSIVQATIEQNMRVESLVKRNRLTRTDSQLSVVRIVDERLQQMTDLMRSPSNSAFALLSRLTEIRGLLLDMRR